MTFLGKILTVLILVMSVLFLGLSVAVHATHTNWKKLVSNENPGPGEKKGYVQQLEELKLVNQGLKNDDDFTVEGRFEPMETSEIGVIYRLTDAKVVEP